jgi:RNA polymerase sigma-70 factor, ECF subfamily
VKLTSTTAPPLDAALVQRLYRRARADRWSLPADAFAASLARSAGHALEGDPPTGGLERYFDSLHLEDLALACACAEGLDSAWEHFVTTYRPALYRAADAIDPSGGAREAADSLYGELFGLSARDGERQSHFRYFHGRSSLSTWLRAVLSQRHVDRIRRDARLVPLPSDDGAEAAPLSTSTPAPSSAARDYVELLGRVLTTVIAALAARDRLRLRCYYSQELTLAQIGKLLGEHEATVSRKLARTRRKIREDVERELQGREGMSDGEVAECFAAALEDPGAMNLAELVGPEPALDERRKKAVPDRST